MNTRQPPRAPQPGRKIVLPDLLWLLFLAACGQLERIPPQPPQTPADWLSSQPYTAFTIGGQTIFLMQPTSTLFVYTLGLVAIGIGLHAWRR